MDSEIQAPERQAASAGTEPAQSASGSAPGRADGTGPAPEDTLRRIFLGPQGLRAGWSVVLLFLLMLAFEWAFFAAGSWFANAVLHRSLDTKEGMTPFTGIFREAISLLALISAAAVVRSEEHTSELHH